MQCNIGMQFSDCIIIIIIIIINIIIIIIIIIIIYYTNELTVLFLLQGAVPNWFLVLSYNLMAQSSVSTFQYCTAVVFSL